MAIPADVRLTKAFTMRSLKSPKADHRPEKLWKDEDSVGAADPSLTFAKEFEEDATRRPGLGAEGPGAASHQTLTVTKGRTRNAGGQKQQHFEAEPIPSAADVVQLLWPEAAMVAQRWKAAEMSGDQNKIVKLKTEFVGKFFKTIREEE